MDKKISLSGGNISKLFMNSGVWHTIYVNIILFINFYYKKYTLLSKMDNIFFNIPSLYLSE